MASEPVEAERRTVARAAATAAERFGDRVALRHREGGEWRVAHRHGDTVTK